MSGADVLVVDGASLSLADLVRVARDPAVPVEVAPAAWERVAAGRAQIDGIVERYRERYAREGVTPVQDYGVTTGFGEFKDIPVSPADLEALQRNLLLSHCVGVGESAEADDPANYFPAEVVRATLLIRLNAFLKGHSGVRPELVETVRRMLVRGVVPLVPIRGSLGSSGDLCPLAHLFVVLLGEGRYYRVASAEDLRRFPAALSTGTEQLTADLGAPPMVPSFKEGLALINGATVSAAALALAVWDAEVAVATADVAASLSLEAACGCARAFDPEPHAARGHRGQIDSAANVRALVAGSTLIDAAGAVQDPYSLRCAPVVHGTTREAIAYVRGVVEREMNAATDNPLFFPTTAAGESGREPWDWSFSDNWPPGYDGRQRFSYSAGNFHGQPIAVAADFLAIAASELANVAERRVQLLLDRHHNRNLPSNLIARRGVNSGYMLAQYSAASLVSENKVLAHPASVDSIPTGANIEDHVAVATTAARKARTILANVQATLAIELLVATQAVDWRVGMARAPRAAASTTAVDVEVEAEAFARATAQENRAAIAGRLGAGTGAAYLAVRSIVPTLTRDRTLDGEIRRVRRLIAGGELLARVNAALGSPLRPVA